MGPTENEQMLMQDNNQKTNEARKIPNLLFTIFTKTVCTCYNSWFQNSEQHTTQIKAVLKTGLNSLITVRKLLMNHSTCFKSMKSTHKLPNPL